MRLVYQVYSNLSNNLKNKIKTFKFRTTFFGENIVMIWGDSYYSMANYVEKVEGLDIGVLREVANSGDESLGLTAQNPEEPKNIYIFLSDLPSNIMPTVMHELMHGLFIVLEDVGANPMDSSREWFAYWVGDCVKQLEDNKIILIENKSSK